MAGTGGEGHNWGAGRKHEALPVSTTASMIHWTRQIKEVLSTQESVEIGENLGPLEEIEFWHNRCTDLSGISKQLVKQGVKHIETILQLAKSSYLSPFLKLAQQIQVERLGAQSPLGKVGGACGLAWVGVRRGAGTAHRLTQSCGKVPRSSVLG